MARALILSRVSRLSPGWGGSLHELDDEVASVVPERLRVKDDSSELDVVVVEVLLSDES